MIISRISESALGERHLVALHFGLGCAGEGMGCREEKRREEICIQDGNLGNHCAGVFGIREWTAEHRTPT